MKRSVYSRVVDRRSKSLFNPPHTHAHVLLIIMSRQALSSLVRDLVDSTLKGVSISTGKVLNTMPSSVAGVELSTILCFIACFSLFPAAYFLSERFARTANARYRLLFFWHAFDALIHILIEGSFLYECFFSYANAYGPQPYFLGHKGRIYGASFGRGPTAILWREYAKADHRWAIAEPTIVSIELLTVLLGGPAAAYACYLLWKMHSHRLRDGKKMGIVLGQFWFLATVLATAELYGGFMTFVPEFLTGCSQLETGNLAYVVLHLAFFNGVWVVVPVWVLMEAYKEFISTSISHQAQRSKR